MMRTVSVHPWSWHTGCTWQGSLSVCGLPHRFSEGYGLSEKIIDEIVHSTVLTVDNGIAAHAAVKKAKEKGLTVLVTDHHLPVRNADGRVILPEADVVVDPSAEGESEWHDYCGAAVAYRFVKELLGAEVPELKVLASIATVADIMPPAWSEP